MMTPEELEHVLEAAIFAAAEPLTTNQLAQMITEEERPERDAVKAALDALVARYESRGVQLKQVASGYLFVTNPETAPYMQRLLERKPPRYSRALLETLALIIYRQPITRGEIEQVRGVAVSTKIIQTLLEREWVAVVGHKAVPGQPALYAPTRQLFDYFNIKDMNELPPLADLVDLEDVGEKLSKQLALSIPEQENADEEVEETILQPEQDDDEAEVDQPDQENVQSVAEDSGMVAEASEVEVIEDAEKKHEDDVLEV